MRQGISLERIDSERARLLRTTEALQLAAEATDKFWVKLVRKIESESFNDAHACQWKLGVSHESFFPGRKRVVLRPRFDVIEEEPYRVDDEEMREREREVDDERRRNRTKREEQQEENEENDQNNDKNYNKNNKKNNKNKENDGNSDGNDENDFNVLETPFGKIGDIGDVKAALAKALGSLINDITQSTPTDHITVTTTTNDGGPGGRNLDGSGSRNLDDKVSPRSTSPRRDDTQDFTPVPGPSVPPGCGWGLVDADGSDEGYGVIGLEMGLESDHIVVNHNNHNSNELEVEIPNSGNGNGSKESTSHNVKKSGTNTHTGTHTGTNVTKSGIGGVSGVSGVIVSSTNDRMGDVRLVEATMKDGRDAVETGPCHSGTKKAGTF